MFTSVCGRVSSARHSRVIWPDGIGARERVLGLVVRGIGNVGVTKRLGRIDALSLCDSFSRKICNALKVVGSFTINRTYLIIPILKNINSSNTFFVCWSKTINFVSKVQGHVFVEFGMKQFAIETRYSTN